jgi:hypothetical protein
MANPFFFLLGCPRSGTTLFGRMIDAHREMAVVPEIRWLARRYTLREGLTPDGRLTPSFFANLKKFSRFTHMPLGEDELAPFVASPGAISYADFMTVLYDALGKAHGKRLVGQKNADHAVPTDVPVVLGLWPEAKVVHLVRDGRDVCLSVLNWRIRDKVERLFSTWNECRIATLAAWWEWQIRLLREAGSALGPQKYLEVRYEALVAHPEETCAQLCDFMGVAYDPDMLHFHEHAPDRKAKQAWLPPTPGRRDWRSQMTRDDQERFEAVAGPVLDELGYERGVGQVSAAASRTAVAVRAAFALRPLPRRWLDTTAPSSAPIAVG